MSALTPKDHREKVALFRFHVLESVLFQKMPRGVLKAEFRRLSEIPFVPPGQDASRTFSVPTLDRWRRAWRRGGLPALAPDAREDRGHAPPTLPSDQPEPWRARIEATVSACYLSPNFVLSKFFRCTTHPEPATGANPRPR